MVRDVLREAHWPRCRAGPTAAMVPRSTHLAAVTDYTGWDEVDALGPAALFAPEAPPQRGRASRCHQAEVAAKGGTVEDQVAALGRTERGALRLPLSLGESSHRPGPPARPWPSAWATARGKTQLLNAYSRR